MNPIGVIVGRFQVPELHAGHRYLIEEVSKRHKDVLVVVGFVGGLATKKDPLDYRTRELMILKKYPGVVVRGLQDRRSDEEWSARLDRLIGLVCGERKAILYGSRDSFIASYHGAFEVVELPGIFSPSGTAMRIDAEDAPKNSVDFRAGVVYGVSERPHMAYQVVDVAVVREETEEVLLAQKDSDGDKWRFIGGFVDPADESLEYAAKRETAEETSMIEVGDFRYVGSTQINDWRYRGSGDTIMSAFFLATYIFGTARASDDIARVKWVPWRDARKMLVKEHDPLGALFEDYMSERPRSFVQYDSSDAI